MRTIKVTWNDGTTMITSINGTDEQIRKYYIGQRFIQVNETGFVVGCAVEFLD